MRVLTDTNTYESMVVLSSQCTEAELKEIAFILPKKKPLIAGSKKVDTIKKSKYYKVSFTIH